MGGRPAGRQANSESKRYSVGLDRCANSVNWKVESSVVVRLLGGGHRNIKLVV